MVVLDDAADDGQSQTGAAFLGRKVGKEQLFLYRRGDAVPCVRHHDLHGIAAAIGDRPLPARGYLETMAPDRVRRRLYLIALERGFLDSTLDWLVVEPFGRLAARLTDLDRLLCGMIAARPFVAIAGEMVDGRREAERDEDRDE